MAYCVVRDNIILKRKTTFRTRRFSSPVYLYQPVDKNEQAQPDHVHEVPVPRNALKAKMILGFEVTGKNPEEDDRQHDRADCYVEAVKPRKHEKRRAIRPAGQLQVEVGISMAVFI